MDRQTTEKCAENQRLLMQYLAPPGFDTDNLLKMNAEELSTFEMRPFLASVQKSMAQQLAAHKRGGGSSND